MSSKMARNTTRVLVVFGNELPQQGLDGYTHVVTSDELRGDVMKAGAAWVSLDGLLSPGSIYEASQFLESLSRLVLPDGTRVSKAFVYKGYELWWTNYNTLFMHFCLPYTQQKKLLHYLEGFDEVAVYRPTYPALIECYLKSRNVTLSTLRDERSAPIRTLPFGVLLQMLITLISIPILIVRRPKVVVYTGDSLEKGKDYSFRLVFFYNAIRERGIPFFELIRSLEPWRKVLAHAWRRKRPAIYVEAIVFLSRFLSMVSGGKRWTLRRFGHAALSGVADPEERFKLVVATQYLRSVYEEVWATRIYTALLKAIGVHAAFIAAASERNFSAVIACKLRQVPTVGILHGVSSRNYNVYDFMPGYDSDKQITVDLYGVWSEWWKQYYEKNGKAYLPHQLVVSGPIRPLVRGSAVEAGQKNSGPVKKVLFVGEQLAVPQEVLPYLEALLADSAVEVYISFRAYRDRFEEWLKKHRPDILDRIPSQRQIRTGILDALTVCDMAVGSHSTAVLEALCQKKPIAFFKTNKWGDYFDLEGYDQHYNFFVQNERELLTCIHMAGAIPKEVLQKLLERFFGDPYKNGSAWVVDQLDKSLGAR